ncbi:hypothetical protein GT037_005161 [Alternaria burnsii]|uniref:Uncharacterized protein n=1 Tax=Alternaria burnsii TaxID=1187904 RepID=A0A8H7B5T0_9PLEO|nr:uncharacterized protein GT037_005161 [Alternaria burnsii]KAF7676949.1 hypothetical protein GT037_005161 [Alternaria burnsii]
MLSLRQTAGRLPIRFLITPPSKATSRQRVPPVIYTRNYSRAKPQTQNPVKDSAQKADAKSTEEIKPKKKTQAELDAEVMAKLAGHDSEGGEAGIEYEDGKPASMKRSVKNNMFRYI